MDEKKVSCPRIAELEQEKKANIAWLWIAGISILAIIISAILWMNNKPGNPSPVNQPNHDELHTQVVMNSRDTGQDYTIDIGAGVQLDMVWIPAGLFMMGSPSSESGRVDAEGPETNVTLEGFWMGKYEVTQAQYQAVTGENPSYFSSTNNPVERVSWNHAMEFCRKLSEIVGESYTIPTEAQWEYACRAGTTTAYYFGNYSDQLGSYAWYSSNSSNTTHTVGGKQPNAWGLYDMHGNVWEWCLSLFEDYPYSETDGRNSLSDTSSLRVLRGGSWYWCDNPEVCRCANRYYDNPTGRNSNAGFRVVCSPKTQ